MTPILRHAPGVVVPAAGTYVLVGHFGEATNLAVECLAGERLPSIMVAADVGPFWYVRVDVANEEARVA